MKSPKSEENKSNSITSDSERQYIRKRLHSFVYPTMPENNKKIREFGIQKIKIATNLYELNFIDKYHKLSLFNIEILPSITEDNYLLKRQINNYIETLLPKSFKKSFFSGNILLTIIKEDKNENENKNYDIIEYNEQINDLKYNIKLIKVKEVLLKNVNNFQGYNQKIKTIIEILFRSVLLRNPNVIKFKDRTIFEIDKNNITNVTDRGNDNIYHGYITSANITENGLYMLINNVNKLISGKTVHDKMMEIWKKLENLKVNCSLKDIEEEIKEYFKRHKTVLTTYGSLRTYRIEDITFDKNPKNTVIKMKDIENRIVNVPIINYYENQYGIKIKDIKQPLIIAQKNSKIQNLISENDYIIYLVPELVYLTGNEDD
jgi:PHD/YefM family antitoxin component YafN of YafNO toxin-antitoxin module